jgi:hypothetical protein
MMDWLGDNAHQMDAKEAENQFKTSFPILLESEVVELVFKVRSVVVVVVVVVRYCKTIKILNFFS